MANTGSLSGVSGPVISPTLAGLRRGDTAIVVGIIEAKAAARLGARGVVPGAEIRVLRAGDPCLVGIDDARWAFSALDAAAVQVEPRTRSRFTLFRR